MSELPAEYVQCTLPHLDSKEWNINSLARGRRKALYNMCSDHILQVFAGTVSSKLTPKLGKAADECSFTHSKLDFCVWCSVSNPACRSPSPSWRKPDPALPDHCDASLNLFTPYTFNLRSLFIYSMNAECLLCTRHRATHEWHKQRQIIEWSKAG